MASLGAQRDQYSLVIDGLMTESRLFTSSLAENLMVITALRSFVAEAERLTQDFPPSEAELAAFRAELDAYYREHGYLDHSSSSLAVAPPSDVFGVIAQYYMLVRNPKPQGAKHEMVEFSDLESYGSMHVEYHPNLRHHIARHGYTDLILVDNGERIVYSVRKDVDLGANLRVGYLSETGLGKAVAAAATAESSDRVSVTDFEFYAPSRGEAVAFMAAPVIDGFGRRLGVVALQMRPELVAKSLAGGMRIMASGDLYVVGADGVLRSPLRRSGGAEVLKTRVENAAVVRALSGETGTAVFVDEGGVARRSAFGPLPLTGLNWALIAAADEDEALAMVAHLRLTGIAMMLVTLLIVTFMAWLQARSVRKQLGGEPSEFVAMAERMADGVFDTPVDELTADGVGAACTLSNMKQRLSETIANIRLAAANVESGAREIANGNAMLSQRTEDQASHLQITAGSMNEMTTTVQLNTGHANRASALAADARREVERGVDAVGKTVRAMSEINHSSREITEITSVIDEIAFQTNLLALNAAVEAARAGEQGKGFAVVATEVRTLAQRSAAAAQEIKALIESSAEKVATGSRLVDAAGTTLEAILEAVNKVNEIVSEISQAGDAQLGGIESVNRSVMEMDEMTQQNAALVEQVAAASEAMGIQAQKLSRLLGFFQLSAVQQFSESSAHPSATQTQESRVAIRAGRTAGRATSALPPERPQDYAGHERRSAVRPWRQQAKENPIVADNPRVSGGEWTEF
ncbi:MAG: methyl-accepting chemotaxis protein [Thiotrichales bacterium]